MGCKVAGFPVIDSRADDVGLSFRAAGYRGFDPRLVAGCVLYLDPALGITLNGSTVSAWANQGTAGGSVSQGTGAAQPTYSAAGGPNGRPCLTFDGGDQLDSTLAASAWASLHQSATVFCVFKSSTNTSSASAFFCLLSDSDSTASRTGFAVGWDNRSPLSRTGTMSAVVGNGSGTYVVSGAASNASFPYNVDCLLEQRLEYGASGDDYSVRSSGASVLSVESGAAPATGAPQLTLSVGALNSGFRFIGTLSYATAFSRAVTEAEAAWLRRGTANRFALTVS